jgi:hypothetical protein
MNKTYIPALFFVILLAVLHFYASNGHWYVRFPGFDILMHILGGLALSFSIYWLIATCAPKYTPSFWSLIMITFLAGFAWEIMETVNDIAGAPVGTLRYYLDSIKDLCDDTIGAIIAAYFIKK